MGNKPTSLSEFMIVSVTELVIVEIDYVMSGFGLFSGTVDSADDVSNLSSLFLHLGCIPNF